MAMNHAVSELVCLLRNGQLAKKNKIVTNYSKMKQSILEILQKEGYIKSFNIIKVDSFDRIEIELAYFNGQPVIKEISVISKPGQRQYAGINEIPAVFNGLGMVILSTPKGILCDYDAKNAKVGGELLLRIF